MEAAAFLKFGGDADGWSQLSEDAKAEFVPASDQFACIANARCGDGGECGGEGHSNCC